MGEYDNATATAARLIRKRGQLGAIRRTVTTGGGPTDPTGGSSTTTDYPARMALFPVSQGDIDGTFIKSGDWRVLVSTEGLDVEPTTTDRLVTSEGVLTIIEPGKFAPAGEVTHYKMVARK